MNKVFTKISTVTFDRISHHMPESNFGKRLPVDVVIFNTDKGQLRYYDSVEKREDLGHQKFHEDIQAAAAGLNSGNFEGLTIEEMPSKPGKYYIEFNPKYKVI